MVNSWLSCSQFKEPDLWGYVATISLYNVCASFCKSILVFPLFSCLFSTLCIVDKCACNLSTFLGLLSLSLPLCLPSLSGAVLDYSYLFSPDRSFVNHLIWSLVPQTLLLDLFSVDMCCRIITLLFSSFLLLSLSIPFSFSLLLCPSLSLFFFLSLSLSRSLLLSVSIYLSI